MKASRNPFIRTAALRSTLTLAVAMGLGLLNHAHALSATWEGDTNGNWNNIANWSAAFPNASGEVATFNADVPNSVITLGQDITISSIKFNTGAEAYTFNAGNKFILGGAGDITVASGVTSQIINTNIQLGGDRSANTYNIVNNSTTSGQSLTIGGGITSPTTGGTAGVKVLAVAGAGNINMGGAITIGGATGLTLTKAGAGILTLSSTGTINNANTTGVTGTISGGTFRIDGGTAKFNVTASNATGLQVGGNTASSGGSLGVTNNGTLNVNTGRLILGGNADASTGTSSFTQDSGITTVASNFYSGNYHATNIDISGGSFTVSGSSIISQRANTNFNISGSTTIVTFGATLTLGTSVVSFTPTANMNLNGGTLSVANIANGTLGTTAVNFNGGTLQARADNADFLRADSTTIGNSGGTIDTQAFNVTIAQPLLRLSGAATDALTKIGSGALTISGANTYGGGTNIQSGSIIIGGGNDRLLTTSSVTLGAASTTGKLVLGDGTARTQTLAGLTTTGSGGSVVGGAAANSTLTINTAGTVAFGGVLGGVGTNENNLALAKTNTGTLTLSGPNTYTGGTSITGGRLTLNRSGGPAIQGNVSLSNNTNVQRPVLYFGANNQLESTATISAAVSGANTVYTDVVLAGSSQTIASYSTSGAPGSAGGSFIQNGFYSGDTGAGVLTINNSSTVTLGGGASSNRLNIRNNNGTGGGTLALVKDGAGTLVFNLTSAAYTGGFTMKAGTVQVAGLAFGTTNSASPLFLEGGTLSSGDGTARSFDPNNTVSLDGNVTLGDATNNGKLTFAGAGTLTGNRELTIASDVDYTGAIGQDVAGRSLTKAGAGTLTLTATNSYGGGTTISAGVLTLSHATNTLADTGAINVNGGILALGANTETVGAVTLTSGSITGSGAGRLTGTGSDFDVRSGSISTKLGGSVGLNKSTSGTVTISSDNSVGGYTGATTVSDGTLVINGNISTSVTTVEDGGTLAGSGRTGSVTVANGGTLAPGNSPGTLSIVGDLGLNDSSILAFEFDPLNMAVGGGINDLVSISGGLTLDGLLNVTASSGSFTSITSGSWRLFDYAGSLTDNLLTLNSMPTLASGYSWSLDTATANQVNLTVIPEPAAALLGGVGMLMLLRRRRQISVSVHINRERSLTGWGSKHGGPWQT